MKTVLMLLFPDVLLLDVAGPVEAFSIANRYLPVEQHYCVRTLAASERQVRASCGIQLVADQLLDTAGLGECDLFLVPGGPGAYNDDHAVLAPWLHIAAADVPRFGSICTGAFILGAAGLLDGRKVTTHWNYIERLAKRHPRAHVLSEQIYLVDGKLYTSGGITAGIDMALGIIAEDHGKALAVAVAKVLLVAKTRQGGQRQFSPLLAELVHEDGPVARAQRYVLEHLGDDLSVEVLAGVVGLSGRHFARLFSREVGMTPTEFVRDARIDHARELLETTSLPLKTIAFRSGFGSVRCMRMQFTERLGLSPAQYRHQFS
jgi:transcriptional regulator GlxA family with amidase domain